MVQKLPRQAGSRESRYAHLFSGPIEVAEEAMPAASRGGATENSNTERIAALERSLAELRREFEDFRGRFE